MMMMMMMMIIIILIIIIIIIIMLQVYWAGPLAGGAVAALIYGAMLDLIDRPYEVSEDVRE